MSNHVPTRKDGTFGPLYADEHKPGDLGRIIAAYRKSGKRKVSYRTAWKRWFVWAGKKVKA